MTMQIERLLRGARDGDPSVVEPLILATLRARDKGLSERFFGALRELSDLDACDRLLEAMHVAQRHEATPLLRRMVWEWACRGGDIKFCHLGKHYLLEDLLEVLECGHLELTHPVQAPLRWDPTVARLYNCDVVERTLAPFEERYPDDKRPREAIAAARAYAIGALDLIDLKVADRAATDAATQVGYSGSPWAAAWVATEDAQPRVVLSNAITSVREGCGEGWPQAEEAVLEEKAWQRRRLLEYLFLDALDEVLLGIPRESA